MSSTRKNTTCPVFGAAKELDGRALPTYEDVMKHCHHVKIKLSSEHKNPPLKCIFDEVIADLLRIWETASIPTVGKMRIMAMIQKCHNKRRNILRSKNTKKGSAKQYEKNVQDFKITCLKLFDISACKCISFDYCSCTKDKKVPNEERDFLKDQRSRRLMVIGSVDVTSTKKKMKSLKRKIIDDARNIYLAEPTTSSNFEKNTLISSSSESANSSCESENSEYEPSHSSIRRMNPDVKMKLPLKSVAILADKTGMSDRAVATIVSATLKESSIAIGDDVEDTFDHVMDRCKVKKYKRARTELQSHSKIIYPLRKAFTLMV